MRFHAGANSLCSLCINQDRDQSLLVVVAGDADLLAFERSGTYRGRYFVLGGTISLANEKASGLRLPQIIKIAKERTHLREIILAFPANPEGDATAERVRRELGDLALNHLRITMLGRGLSTGSELEYADPETLKSAFVNRK
jgi:recombination protein RecR